jgi:hypothetical protein
MNHFMQRSESAAADRGQDLVPQFNGQLEFAQVGRRGDSGPHDEAKPRLFIGERYGDCVGRAGSRRRGTVDR